MKAPFIPLITALVTLGLVTGQEIDLDFTDVPESVDLDSEEFAADDELDELPDELPDEPADDEDDVARDGEEPEEEMDADVVPPGEDDAAELAADEISEMIEEQPAAPEPGLAVRVERLQTGAGAIDPAEVKIHAPFPAKLLAQVPDGWAIHKSERAPEFIREVELAPGSSVTLSVRPHILIPQADGANVFAVNEPGYAPALGYRQDATVGAILSDSIRQLDEDGRRLGDAIDQLQQLLVSLPQSESAPAGP